MDPAPSSSSSPDPAGPPQPGGETQSSGLPENVAGALAYSVGVITGILFLILDRDRPFVLFHASQCLVLFVAGIILGIGLTVLSAVLGVIPVVGFLVSMLISLAVWVGGAALWLFLMWQAWQGKEWEVPIVGPYARQLAAAVAGDSPGGGAASGPGSAA